MIEVKQIVRIFKYQQLELADPGRELSPEQVVEFYSGVYPELVKATVEGPELQGTREIYRMERAVGRKGCEKSPPRLITIKELARGGKKRHNNVRRRKRSDAHSGF
ncbi:MAG: PRTRC system protein C (plasmid) [Candidatus Manganitrophus sp.]|nr:MAG: PRTRC system protein C [Candidatus Manganitrophus sp.]